MCSLSSSRIRSVLRAALQNIRSAKGGSTLPKGQCTWYAWERAREAGWKIRFDVPYNRHAKNWWVKVTNGSKGQAPRAGSVMILGAWPGNPYGHVGYVESVRDNDHWTITHANFGVGDYVGNRDNIPYYRAECERTERGIRLTQDGRDFPLVGFVSPSQAVRSD